MKNLLILAAAIVLSPLVLKAQSADPELDYIKSAYSKEKVNAKIDVISFLAETTIFPSKGEARKMIEGGGMSINKEKDDAAEFVVTNKLLLNEKYLLIQKGKKNYYFVVIS